MRSPRLVGQHQRIQEIIKKALALPDLELQGHLGRYTCVLVAGFAENAISEVYGDYCVRLSAPAVAGFAQKHLERYLNPKAARFVEVAGGFSKAWTDPLKDFLAADGRGDALDAIMSNRHLIAHGAMPGITPIRVRAYLAKIVEVVEFIEGQCAS